MEAGTRTSDPVRILRENRVLHRIIAALHRGRDLEGVLPSVVDLVTEATACDVCFLHLYDADRDRLVLRAASDPYREMVGRVELELGEGVAGWVAAERRPVAIEEDKWSDPRYRYIPQLGGERYTSMLSVPLVSPGDRLVGAVNIHTEARRTFTEDDVAFLEHVAALIAAALEHVELFRELAAKEEALQRLVARTIQAQEDERRRVAGEIHDGVTQHLISIWYRVHAGARRLSADPAAAGVELDEAKRLIDEALDEARTAIYALRPVTLDDLGLVPSIEALARRTFDDEVRVDVRADLPGRLTPHLEMALYRVAQEAMTNSRKHARARSVRVDLAPVDGSIRLRVTDDGVGFDAEAWRRSVPDTSFGLVGIAERVELVGGTVRVTSTPGEGATVEVTVPQEEGDR